MRTFAVIAGLLIASCATTHVVEPTDEQRLEQATAAPPGAIPDGLAFEAKSPAGPAFPREPIYYGGYYGAYGFGPYGGWGGSGVTGGGNLGARTPRVQSNALSHPQGMPGGSRPGLLP